ncbi:MAG: hypothetical protein ABUK01_04730 [Leptospirales bacterium]
MFYTPAIRCFLIAVLSVATLHSGRFARTNTHSEESNENKPIAKKVGVVVSDDTILWASIDRPEKFRYIYNILFKGNEVVILEQVKGELKNRSKIWFYVELVPERGIRGYIHSSYVISGSRAAKYMLEFSPEIHKRKFEKLFPNISFNKAKELYNVFKKDHTIDGFRSVYTALTHMLSVIEKRIVKHFHKDTEKGEQDYFHDLHWVGIVLPGILVITVAEGTEIEPRIDLLLFAQKAALSKDTTDNEFTALMLEAYGPWFNQYFPEWFAQTWDYGGYSRLGTGVHYTLMKKCDAYLNKNNFLNSEIEMIKYEMVHDILNAYDYGGAKPDVFKEIDMILKDIKLTEETTQKLKERRSVLKKNDGKFKYEFNCEKGRCNTGG